MALSYWMPRKFFGIYGGLLYCIFTIHAIGVLRVFKHFLFSTGTISLVLVIGKMAPGKTFAQGKNGEKKAHDPNTRFDPEIGWVPVEGRSITSFGAKKISSNSLYLDRVHYSPQGHKFISSILYDYLKQTYPKQS